MHSSGQWFPILTLAVVFTTPAASQPVTAAINATHTGQPITKLMFGGFMEPTTTQVWAEMLAGRKFFNEINMGIDDFMTFCRLLGAEPYIAVNTGLGDAHSAAEEVEYVNGPATSRLECRFGVRMAGRLRKAQFLLAQGRLRCTFLATWTAGRVRQKPRPVQARLGGQSLSRARQHAIVCWNSQL